MIKLIVLWNLLVCKGKILDVNKFDLIEFGAGLIKTIFLLVLIYVYYSNSKKWPHSHMKRNTYIPSCKYYTLLMYFSKDRSICTLNHG